MNLSNKVEFKKAIKNSNITNVWKILIIDDEEMVHSITASVLKNFVYKNKKLAIFNSYDEKSSKKILEEHNDLALILLDVVMEKDDTGLELVRYIREDLKNSTVRIVLRTGQPGQAPELSVITKYDINDYKEKTELTSTKLHTVVYSAIRTYEYIQEIKENEKELKLLNSSLEEKVQLQLLKIKEQEQFLLQQSKMADIGELLASIAHQWRQPLNIVALGVMNLTDEFCEDYAEDKNFKKHLSDINSSLQYLSRTIDNFRDFYKPSRVKEKFYICDVVSDMLYMFALESEEKNVVLDVKSCDKSIVIDGYKNEFKQIILHLIKNSIESIAKKTQKDADFKGYVLIDVYEKNDYFYITIEDNGGGVSNEIKNKIFQPYFTTKFASQGIGLSLYMSKVIIEKNMSGEMSFENTQDGAKFIIKIAKV